MSIPTPSDLGINVPEEHFDAIAGAAYDNLLFYNEERLEFDGHGCPEWSIFFPELDFRLSLYAMTNERAADRNRGT